MKVRSALSINNGYNIFLVNRVKALIMVFSGGHDFNSVLIICCYMTYLIVE